MISNPAIRNLVFVVSMALLQASIASGQQEKRNPAFAQIEDKPGLPRVLLLGDSISIGYTLAVREQLEGVANVHRPAENCASTRTGLAQLDKWLGDKPWDVIHFNFGLHDQKYVLSGTDSLVATTTSGSAPQVPLAEYEANLEQLVERLKQTGATLIWCTTTPVPAGANGRVPADTLEYNAAAARVMQAHNIKIHDLFAHALPKLDAIQQPKNVHYTTAGSEFLARHVVQEIKQALKP